MLTSRLVALFGVLSLTLLGVAVLTGAAATSARGDTCTKVVPTEGGGFIEVPVECTDDTGGVSNPGDGGGGGGGGDGETRECVYAGNVITCETAAGVWNGTCYVKVADPQPDPEHPVWRGNTDGVILQCTIYEALQNNPNPAGVDCDAGGGCPGGTSLFWAASAPGAGPSAIELARRVVAQMQLSMGSIGSTPPEGTTSALVGLPIWLWVENPAPNTSGPITDSASEGGVTVTATGTLDRIEYIMVRQSDGYVAATVTCAGDAAVGTAYEAGYGDAQSPTCGFGQMENQQVGVYTITGTAFWNVEWAGGGQAGSIPVDVSDSIELEVGELQVIQVESP